MISVLKEQMPDERLIKISKILSWILRHGVLELKLTFMPDGYVPLTEVLAVKNLIPYGVTEELIREIVRTDNKNRYSLLERDNGIWIRANQGHNSAVGNKLNDEVMLTPILEPLPVCVYGTTQKAWKTIQVEGLKPMSRKHIHFATSATADACGASMGISGIRPNAEVKIYIDMKSAMNDGIKFYASNNGVILTESPILPKYFFLR